MHTAANNEYTHSLFVYLRFKRKEKTYTTTSVEPTE